MADKLAAVAMVTGAVTGTTITHRRTCVFRSRVQPQSVRSHHMHSWRFEGNYFDPSSGRLFVVARPDAQPELWVQYMEGARGSYRQHGVEGALDYDRVRDGRSTALFVAAVDLDGRVVGGLRVQGPYTHVGQAAAVAEWAGRKGTEELRRQIGARLDDGVIEIKAVWVDHDAARHSELTAALARVFIHLLKLMGVRYAFCTAASHAVSRWQSSGGVVSDDVAAVAYPDERYRTFVMWWDRQNVFQFVAADQIPALVMESGQPFQRPIAVPADSPSGAA